MASQADQTDIDSKATARVLVVLCTYNEIGNLPKMFELLRRHLPLADVLVVDDNSPDGTGQWVEEQSRTNDSTNHSVHLLSRPGKLGLGTALRDAVKWCLDRDYDYLVNLDADLSHNPASAADMLSLAERDGLDVVVGTRYRQGGDSPGLAWHRKIISRTLNWYATRLLRLPISDCSGSYRCYRVRKLAEVNLSELTCPGYGFLEEILSALKKQGATFGEVPIVFDCRYAGESKLGLSDALGAIRVIHSLALRRR